MFVKKMLSEKVSIQKCRLKKCVIKIKLFSNIFDMHIFI